MIGPCFSDIIGIPDTTRRWKAELARHGLNVEELRKKNEGFMRVLLSLSRTDFGKISSIDTHFSWQEADASKRSKKQSRAARNRKSHEPPLISIRPTETSLPKSSEDASDIPDLIVGDPRLFLTDYGAIGLAPPSARQGDRIHQFLHSDVVAVVRAHGDSRRIVGRGVVANASFSEGSKFFEPDDVFMSSPSPYDEALYMDMRTLQMMTQ